MYLNDTDVSALSERFTKNYENLIRRSGPFRFDFTKFYEQEFGTHLVKEFLVFEKDIQENLVDAKLFCMDLEQRFKKNSKRIFNIDPGYITKNKFVLASKKPRPHRILLRDKVYADLQLVFENNTWKSFAWTFPDVISLMDFWTHIRKEL